MLALHRVVATERDVTQVHVMFLGPDRGSPSCSRPCWGRGDWRVRVGTPGPRPEPLVTEIWWVLHLIHYAVPCSSSQRSNNRSCSIGDEHTNAS